MNLNKKLKTLNSIRIFPFPESIINPQQQPNPISMKSILHATSLRFVLRTGMVLLFLIPVIKMDAQVLIAPTPGTPHSSSMLEIQSSDKALLIPRLTLANRPTGTNGLMYYQTDNTPGFYFYNNGSYRMINFNAMDYWQINGGTLYHNNYKVAVGTDDADGHGLFSEHYSIGKAAVVGSETSTYGTYSLGMLGVLQPGGFGLPISVINAGVLGIKPNDGANGAAVYGWNNDDNSSNYAGLFYADGKAQSGETNYGIYSVADSSAGSNIAGFFKGRLQIEGHSGASATDSAQTLLNVNVNHGSNIDTRGINVSSNPADGYGIGLFSTGGYQGVNSRADAGSYSAHAYGVLGTATGTAGYRYGVYGVASGSGAYNYGVLGLVNTTATWNYGVKGETTTGNNSYGVFANAHGSGTNNYGILALANSATTNYGVRTTVNGSSTNNYGFYADVSGGTSNNWAAYLIGEIYGSKTLSIGTTNTSFADVHIVGQTTLGKMILAPSSTVNDSAMIFLSEASTPTYGMGWLYDGNNNKMKLFTDGSSATADYDHIIIQRDGGEIAINTETFASGYQMSVNGKIICTELRVADVGSWPDYVFSSEYQLMPLDELEESITENGHLPNIPSAAQVEAEGMEVGQMNKLLMEKVEELTLYIIDLNKQLEAQNERIEELENQNK